MNRQTVRFIALCVMLITGAGWLAVSTASYIVVSGSLRADDPALLAAIETFWVSIGTVSTLNMILSVTHMLSTVVFLILLHYDLGLCERWVAWERSRLASGESSPLANDPGAGAVGAPNAATSAQIDRSV